MRFDSSPNRGVGHVERRKAVHDGHVQGEIESVFRRQPRYVQRHTFGSRHGVADGDRRPERGRGREVRDRDMQREERQGAIERGSVKDLSESGQTVSTSRRARHGDPEI